MAGDMPSLPCAPSKVQYPSPIDPTFIDRLDADFIDYYNQYMAIKPVTHGVTIEDIRATPKKFTSPWCHDFSYEPFVNDMKVTSDDGHVFTVRCYTPDSRTSPFGSGPYPLHINFHGGGYAFGDLTGDAELCMLVRNRVGMTVIDVDYRLTPENTMLRGHDDAWAAIRWAINNAKELNIRADSVSIGGISAGGHISAVCQQLARDAGINLKLAILAVPATTSHVGLQKPSDCPFASYTDNALAPCLNFKRMKYFMDMAVASDEASQAEYNSRPQFFKAPIDGNVAGVCDTFIATADCDPLRDEGEAYGAKLLQAGVRVSSRRYTGVPHPFMHMLVIKKAQMYVDDICGELRRVHGA